MKKSVVILGSGSHAKCVIEILRAMDEFNIVGCVVDDTDPTRLVSGIPIIGPASRIETLAKEGFSVAIGVGGWTNNIARKKLFDRAVALGLEIVSPIDPRAHISPSAVVGRGSVVFSGADLGVDVVLGENVMIGTNSLVSHESRIGDHTLISGGVSVGGLVIVGNESLIALGATVASNVVIGERSLVSAGAVVVEDVPPRGCVRRSPKQVD